MKRTRPLRAESPHKRAKPATGEGSDKDTPPASKPAALPAGEATPQAKLAAGPQAEHEASQLAAHGAPSRPAVIDSVSAAPPSKATGRYESTGDQPELSSPEALPAWTYFFTDVDSAEATLAVDAACSATVSNWLSDTQGDRFNISLFAPACSSADARQYPAHIAVTDLAAYSEWHCAMRRQRLDMATPPDMSRLVVDIPVEQVVVHCLVKAVYSRSIQLSAQTIEDICRAADYMQMPCITKACVQYIKDNILPKDWEEVEAFQCDVGCDELESAVDDWCLHQESWDDLAACLTKLCAKRSLQKATALLQRFQHTAPSRLQVVDVLLAVHAIDPHRELGVSLDVFSMHAEEVAALARRLSCHIDKRQPLGCSNHWVKRLISQVFKALLDPSRVNPPKGSAMVVVEMPSTGATPAAYPSKSFTVDGRAYKLAPRWLADTGTWSINCYPPPGETFVTEYWDPTVEVFILGDGETSLLAKHLHVNVKQAGHDFVPGQGFGWRTILKREARTGEFQRDGLTWVAIYMHVSH